MSAWPGVRLPGQVIYELHVGTFTPEGTWTAAAEKLPHLRDLGITLIEVMPVAAFPGKFGWGYDGVVLVRANGALRQPGRLSRVCRSGASAGHRRDSRRRLQPLRPVRQLHGRVFALLRLEEAPHGMGRRDQLRRRTLRARSRLRRGERRLLDSRVSPRRPAARRDARDRRRFATSTSSRSCARRLASRRRRPVDPHLRERTNDNKCTTWCRRKRAATASTDCGTTTFIMRAASPPRETARRTTATTPARRRN